MRRFVCTALLLCGLSIGLRAQEDMSGALKSHVRALTDPALLGRASGSEGERAAARYISRFWTQKGLDFFHEGGWEDFSMLQEGGDTLRSQNIVALVPGYDPKLRNEYLVVGAHYDHLGGYPLKVNGRDSLCHYPGAYANASGTALLLELARRVKEDAILFKRSVIFVAFGAKEAGMGGSWYFVNRSYAGETGLRLMANLEMIGYAGDRHSPQAYVSGGNELLRVALHEAGQHPVSATLTVKEGTYFPSDHLSFAQNGIPVCLFTTGLAPDYHSLRDDGTFLDYELMSAYGNTLYNFLLDAANASWLSREAGVGPASGASKETPIYALAEVEKAPRFQNGGMDAFERWIYKYLKYPQEAVRDGIRGTVTLSFVVEADGTVDQVQVERSVDPLLDEAALKVVKVSPKWKPAVKNGKPVRVKCVMPVHFRLAPR